MSTNFAATCLRQPKVYNMQIYPSKHHLMVTKLADQTTLFVADPEHAVAQLVSRMLVHTHSTVQSPDLRVHVFRGTHLSLHKTYSMISKPFIILFSFNFFLIII
jgi:hypothetical protein